MMIQTIGIVKKAKHDLYIKFQPLVLSGSQDIYKKKKVDHLMYIFGLHGLHNHDPNRSSSLEGQKRQWLQKSASNSLWISWNFLKTVDRWCTICYWLGFEHLHRPVCDHKSWSKPLVIFRRWNTTMGPNFSCWKIIHFKILKKKNSKQLYLFFFHLWAPNTISEPLILFVRLNTVIGVKFQRLIPCGS